jgi:hypothetical protein
LQTDFASEALEEKSRSLRARTAVYSKGENYAEKYNADDVGNGFVNDRKRDTRSRGLCALPNSAAAAAC